MFGASCEVKDAAKSVGSRVASSRQSDSFMRTLRRNYGTPQRQVVEGLQTPRILEFRGSPTASRRRPVQASTPATPYLPGLLPSGNALRAGAPSQRSSDSTRDSSTDIQTRALEALLDHELALLTEACRRSACLRLLEAGGGKGPSFEGTQPQTQRLISPRRANLKDPQRPDSEPTVATPQNLEAQLREMEDALQYEPHSIVRPLTRVATAETVSAPKGRGEEPLIVDINEGNGPNVAVASTVKTCNNSNDRPLEERTEHCDDSILLEDLRTTSHKLTELQQEVIRTVGSADFINSVQKEENGTARLLQLLADLQKETAECNSVIGDFA